ncbi:DUF2809 domain-containing protein [Tenacibaculum soleae]|uniref:DUF2809 domain-containing protein n=1 Tax=Tenacibaculum soleae TaxID=447689 RepID=A0A1B9Y324_9FLAO|nr:DUF2809 domain-containing protein [Tenacibaculum soleae]MDO6744901.1 DUF2809 domain-containing protein [Tenacibaculum soleae]MDO6813087.1 DUF2809 domain-containing protein [Tenacibaculum soleae]OCK44214.1 hypothetical protein BA195_05900 [Tenacibaculum soleae]
MKFNLTSFIIFILLFITEILIAQTSGFIRHTFGDFLVVILLYYLIKSFFNISSKKLAISILIFSFSIEILQNYNLVKILGLENYRIANIIIGNTFSYYDLIAYTLGITVVLTIELITKK